MRAWLAARCRRHGNLTSAGCLGGRLAEELALAHARWLDEQRLSDARTAHFSAWTGKANHGSPRLCRMFHRCKTALYRWHVATAALFLFGSEGSALAEPSLEPIALSYLAPEACPSFNQFLAEVQRSTPRLRLARADEPARHFEVKIEASGLTGQLTLDGGQGGERAVRGVDCRAVADLLAFAVALAADPDARPAESTRGVATFPALGSAAQEAEQKPRLAPVAAQPPEPVTARPTPRPGPRLKWGAAALGFASTASSPAPTWGGGAFAELQLSAMTWAPRFRLGANYAKKTFTREPVQVEFTTAFLSFEFCSGALHRGSFTFLPCLRAQGGTRNAEGGEEVPDPRSVLRGFLDLGVAGHVRYRLAGPAFIELGAAILFPTVHDQVLIRPDTVYEVPRLGALGECALGVEFGDQPGDGGHVK